MGICRNCGNRIIIDGDYFGFCSVFCCCDYAHRNDLTIKNAKHGNHSERIEELEEELVNCQYEITSLRSVEDSLRDDIDSIDNELIRMEREVDRALKSEEKTKEINKKLYKENKDLLETVKKMGHNSKRFELIDLENKINE
jgi:septal ring factor EnvC (AmiA/AmiB activator)